MTSGAGSPTCARSLIHSNEARSQVCDCDTAYRREAPPLQGQKSAMHEPFPHDRDTPGRCLRGLERAAAHLNPYLTAIVIGLSVLNLTCLALLAPHWVITRNAAAFSACPSPFADPRGAVPR